MIACEEDVGMNVLLFANTIKTWCISMQTSKICKIAQDFNDIHLDLLSYESVGLIE